ncbi:hypothetical protein GGF41_001270 [Coemansia sp. RSA 2531]|nr:hypothetical protein GGF41_001270 [Coemansia sp. RSA 2531]
MKLTAVLYTPTKDHVDIMQLAVIAKEVLGATPERYRSPELKYLYLSSKDTQSLIVEHFV